jgi:hypothetical protein
MPFVTFSNKLIFKVNCIPTPNPQLEDHPLSDVRDCLINIFEATLHLWRISVIFYSHIITLVFMM